MVDERGNEAEGWGETPLSVQWAWPSPLPYQTRHQSMREFCVEVARAWARFPPNGHPIEFGSEFLGASLPKLIHAANTGGPEPIPTLAALVCSSPFDIALHDAFGNLVKRPIYDTYGPEWLRKDLAAFAGTGSRFRGVLFRKIPIGLPVAPADPPTAGLAPGGGLDPLDAGELTGTEPEDGHPVLLEDWIRRDGLKCLKVKLRGNNPSWDYQRLVGVGTSRCGTESNT